MNRHPIYPEPTINKVRGGPDNDTLTGHKARLIHVLSFNPHNTQMYIISLISQLREFGLSKIR